MSKFFQSELVRGDIQEMAALQEFCFRSVTNLALLDKERKLQYFEALKKLLDKQKVFHARLQLSDDPEAKQVADNMKQAVVMLGGDPNLEVRDMFDDLLTKIKIENIATKNLRRNPQVFYALFLSLIYA